MRVVLHVGAHKTGTTLIQVALREHADELRARGVGYFDHNHPDVRESGVPGVGRCLSRHGITADMPDRFVRLFDATTAGPWNTTLISSETLLAPNVFRGEVGTTAATGIYPFAQQRFEWMRAASGFPTRIVLYLRRQAGLLESLHAQFSWQGLVRPFPEWLEEIDLDSLSWRPIVAAAVAAMGADSVVIKGFQLPAIGPTAHLSEFLEDALDIHDVPVEDWISERSNRTLSEVGLMIRRRLEDVPLDDEESRALSVFLKKVFSTRDKPAAHPMTDDVRAYLGKRYDAENASLLREYGAPRDRERPLL